MFGSALTWVQIITVTALAVLTKEYLFLRGLLQEAKRTGICEVKECPDATDTSPQDMQGLERRFEQIYQQKLQAFPKQRRASSVGHLIEAEGSAVWCHGQDHFTRQCRFRHLCYLPSESIYVMFHAPQTTLHGLPPERHTPGLLDMSTVKDHNRLLFSYVDVPAKHAPDMLQDAVLVNVTSLLFQRFNADNIMHVLHDDVLPLFHTLMMITGQSADAFDKSSGFDVQLVMMEGWSPGPYMELYQILSNYKPLLLEDIRQSMKPICFQNAYVGLSKVTTWYQYGFLKPQGPLPSIVASGLHIHQFTSFVKNREEILPGFGSLKESKTIVLFTRRFNRLILNELELTTALAQNFQMKVLTLSLESHSLHYILNILKETWLVISMHGSLLSLSMFLSPGAIVVELFPYAVNPDHYSPFKTLAELPGIGILYKSWRNTDETKTVTHPNNSWDEGGIAHLPQDVQDRIVASKEVPLHLCCKEPEWLFRIYQDTIVDIPAVSNIIRDALAERKQNFDALLEEQHSLICDNISPSGVVNLSCSGSGEDTLNSEGGQIRSPYIKIKWEQPWNLKYCDAEVVQYEIWLQELGKEEYSAWMMSKMEHVFEQSDFRNGVEYLVWVRCVIDDEIIGPFNSEQLVCKA